MTTRADIPPMLDPRRHHEPLPKLPLPEIGEGLTPEQQYTLAAEVVVAGLHGDPQNAMDAYVTLGGAMGFEAANAMLLYSHELKDADARDALLARIGVRLLPDRENPDADA